jgi:hypothetical protein
MKEEDIIALFKLEIEKKDFKEKSGVNKQQHYNYRNRITKIGLMLEILLKVGAIDITKK